MIRQVYSLDTICRIGALLRVGMIRTPHGRQTLELRWRQLVTARPAQNSSLGQLGCGSVLGYLTGRDADPETGAP